MRLTLGWEVAAWMHEHLPDPSALSDADARFSPSDPELDALLDWYALDPSGAFSYRRGALQEAKGWGKSPLAAYMAIAEFRGPVLFDHFEAGEPRGRAWDHPLVQIAALSEDQAASNVYSLIFEALRANDHRAARALGIDEGRGQLYRSGSAGTLAPVTSAAESREGQRVTFGLLEESHLMTRRNGGQALARTMRRNAAKVGGRVFETSNSPELGLGSVAEATLADAERGEPGVLLLAHRPSRLPEPTMTDAELLARLDEVYAGVPWVDRLRILAEVRDPATPWEEAVRYFFNSPAGGSAVLVEPGRWDALAAPGDIPDGARVALGFDGSYNTDGTAIVICDEAGRLRLALLIERKPSDPPGWTVPRREVQGAIADLFARFDVVGMLADPWHWRDELEGWARQYGETIVIEHPTNSVRRFGPAVDRFRTAVAEGRIHHNGDVDLRRHLLNARLVRGRGAAADDGHALYTLEKPGPGRLIDAAVASVLAVEAMAAAPAAKPKFRSNYETHGLTFSRF